MNKESMCACETCKKEERKCHAISKNGTVFTFKIEKTYDENGNAGLSLSSLRKYLNEI